MITTDIDKLKATVALSHRILFATGLATSSGHASARIPGTDRFLIKPWPHIHMSRLRAEDIIMLDLEGNKLDGPENVTRVSEWALHAEVYRARPDVNGVIHTHQKWATMMGIAGKAILPVAHSGLAAVAADQLPIYDEDYRTIKHAHEGKRVAKKLGMHIGVHLRTHGILFAAPNLETAIVEAIHTEYQAELTWLAMQVGKPKSTSSSIIRSWDERRRSDFIPEEWEYYQWLDAHPDSACYRVVQV